MTDPIRAIHYVSDHAESMIWPLWRSRKSTNDIAKALGLPESEIANRLPKILEHHRTGRPMAAGTWTEELTGRLIKLYDKGYSCTLIAAELGNGLTRNAVIGKAHRMNFPRRGGGTHQLIERSRVREYTPKPKPPRPIAPRRIAADVIAREKLRCVEITPRDVGLLDLEPGDCRYPYGDGPFTFCGHPAMEGSRYCRSHFFLSIGPGTSSERAANRVYLQQAAE